MSQVTQSTKALRLQITKSFSLEELEIICADLAIRYDNLPGYMLESKAYNLINHMQQHGRMHDLIQELASRRPHIVWDELYSFEPPTPPPRSDPTPHPQSLPREEPVITRINPLFPVTIAEWRRELKQRSTRFGQPNGYWCYVRPGEYAIGGWKTGEDVETIILPGFWIAKYPITVQQYGQFIGAGGYTTEQYWTPNGWQWRTAYDEGKGRTPPFYWRDKNDSNKNNAHPNQPVVYVTWYEATAFAKWLTSSLADDLAQNEAICLPTEVEWEAAAAYDAHGVRHTYPWGETPPTSDRAIFDNGKKPTPDRATGVGERPAGAAACGAQDMLGNVWECMGSSYAGYPRQSNSVVGDFASGI